MNVSLKHTKVLLYKSVVHGVFTDTLSCRRNISIGIPLDLSIRGEERGHEVYRSAGLPADLVILIWITDHARDDFQYVKTL